MPTFDMSGMATRVCRHAAVLLAASLAAVLSGCGGGSDDNPSRPPPAPTAPESPAAPAEVPQFSIDADNARTVAAEALQLHLSGPGRLALPQARRSITDAGTRACPGGGTVTIRSSPPAASAPAPGTTIEEVTDHCVEGDTTSNGAAQLHVLSSDSQASGALTVLDLTLQDFHSARGGVDNRIDGALRERLDTTEATGPHTVQQLTSAGAAPFTVERIVNGRSRALRTVSGLDLTVQLPLDSSPITQNVAFAASGNFGRLGAASLRVDTLEPLAFALDAVQPVAGKLRVSGPGGGTVALTLSPGSVLLELDADGDGVAEQTEIRTQEEFAADLGD